MAARVGPHSGQLDPIFVWRQDGGAKYLVLEGATRVTVLRELARKKRGQSQESQFRSVKAKVLPPDFPEEHRVILLAQIHVRGDAVRPWGRYIEAKFIHDHTYDPNEREARNGRKALMSMTEMAKWMGRSVSWVTRLRHAYSFAHQYAEHLDSPDALEKAADNFSTLEEIIKSSGFGPRLKGDDAEAQQLRAEVFDMVTHDVFKEYRDARHMKEYFDDPEKWARLRTHERHVANQLAADINARGPSTLKGRIQGLHGQIDRALGRDASALDGDDLEELQRSVDHLASHVAADVGAFRLRLQGFIKALLDVPLGEIKRVTMDEYQELMVALQDFRDRFQKHVGGQT